MNIPDGELVEGLLRGDRRAFEQFFNDYYPKLYRFVRRRMPRDTAAAEDIAQGTLCRALESLRSYRGEAALFTWLCTLCRREMSARCGEVLPTTAPKCGVVAACPPLLLPHRAMPPPRFRVAAPGVLALVLARRSPSLAKRALRLVSG